MGDIFGLVIVRPFGLILMAIFKAVGSYGLAVILFALIVKLISIPLAIKSKKSMMAMTAVQADLQQLQKKYANNRVKLNEEMQKLYDSHGVSPMSGCLPQFIQFPIMMGLYYCVQQPMKFMMGFGDETIQKLASLVGVDATQASMYGQITIAEKLGQMVDASGNFPEAVTSITNGMGELVNIDFNFFGLNLALTPSITDPGLIWLLPILSGLTAFLSSYIMQKMQGNQSAASQNNSLKMMMYMMPLMSVYFGFILPGTISIYWIFNNMLTCVQEVLLTKTYQKKKIEAAERANEMLEEEKRAARAAKIEANRAVQQEQNKKNKGKGDK